jgi:hypothetical protein
MTRSNGVWSTLVSAGMAAAATSATAALLAKKETGSAAAGLNATSHIVWGDEAATHDEADWQHTAVGALLNTGATAGWAAVQRALFPKPKTVWGAAATGAAVSALAYVTDYYLVPKRLTPGFEKRLSPRALFAIYGALAAALATGALLSARKT